MKEDISVGLAVVSYNPAKKKFRSMNIQHIGTYDEDDLLDLLIESGKYVFAEDPC